MDDCPACPRSKHIRERNRLSPRRRRYRAVSERKRRYSPLGCEPCSREDLRISRKPFPYFSPDEPYPPCRERCCFPGQTESGLLNTIRSSILKIFSRKPNQLYMYTMSQLKSVEKTVDKLEDETCCIEGMIKQALRCKYNFDINETRCTLTGILNRVEGIKYDLQSARNCYDPCRDRCEFEFICDLMERVSCLENHLQEMCLHLECLQIPPQRESCCSRPTRTKCGKCCCGPCKSPGYALGCLNPSEGSGCCKPCECGCKASFDKPKCCGARKSGGSGNNCLSKGLCRTSSVIPVGVMLVKL